MSDNVSKSTGPIQQLLEPHKIERDCVMQACLGFNPLKTIYRTKVKNLQVCYNIILLHRDKGRSYAKQIHSKKVLQKTTNQQQQQNYVSRIKQQDDVMRDFPLRDFPIPRHHENLHGQPSLGNRIVAPHNGNQRNQPMNPAFITSHEGYVPSKYNQEDLFNHNAAGDGLHGMQHHRRENLQQAHGPVLPQEAYRAKDLSPRGTMTKELSASKIFRCYYSRGSQTGGCV